MESLTRTFLQPLSGAAAAGVDKKDIKLSVDGDVLSLSVQKDESKEVRTSCLLARPGRAHTCMLRRHKP
jgi:hypothetical protein